MSPRSGLRFYSEHFPLVEVDATFYALPSERNAGLCAPPTALRCARTAARRTSRPPPPAGSAPSRSAAAPRASLRRAGRSPSTSAASGRSSSTCRSRRCRPVCPRCSSGRRRSTPADDRPPGPRDDHVGGVLTLSSLKEEALRRKAQRRTGLAPARRKIRFDHGAACPSRARPRRRRTSTRWRGGFLLQMTLEIALGLHIAARPGSPLEARAAPVLAWRVSSAEVGASRSVGVDAVFVAATSG